MSKFKRIAIYLFAITFCFLIQNVTSAEEIETSSGIKMTQKEYDNLKEQGFSDLAIDQMERTVFDENKDIILDSKTDVTRYYEIKETKNKNNIQQYNLLSSDINNSTYTTTELSEEEYFARVHRLKNQVNEIQPLSSDTTTTSYRRLTTSIQRYNSTIRLYNKFVWDIIPTTRSYDVLSTSIDSMFSPVAGSEYGQQLWSTMNPTGIGGGLTGGSASYSSGSSTYTRSSAGYGVKMDLRNDASNARVVQLEGYMYYNIIRNSSVLPYYINAYGNYSHLKTTSDTSYSYGLDFGGPSISWSGISQSAFDTITTHAQTTY